MSDSLLEVRGLNKSYRSGARTLSVLQELDLRVEEGETVAIAGDSGVGKSTLLHLIGALDRPDSGEVLYTGTDIFAGDVADLARYRNQRIGFVFQMHHLLPEFTAVENVAMPFRIAGRGGGIEAATALLTRLGLEDRLEHLPGALSGGEQQRVAIARAVALGPGLVLADEPTGNLDPGTGRRVFEVLRELQRERRFSLLLASHSERLARNCDRVLRLQNGQLHAMGAAETQQYFEGLGARGHQDPML